MVRASEPRYAGFPRATDDRTHGSVALQPAGGNLSRRPHFFQLERRLMEPSNKAVSDVLASICRASDRAVYDLKVAKIMADDEYQLRIEYQLKRDQWRRWACFWFSISFISWAALATAIALWGWTCMK